MSTDDRLREPPKERLDPSVQRIALADAAAALRAEAHDAVNGHRQVALVKRGPLTVILYAFDAGGALKSHRAKGGVTIQALSGKLELTAVEEVIVLGAGELLALAPNVTHSVRALEASEMLLTVCLDPS